MRQPTSPEIAAFVLGVSVALGGQQYIPGVSVKSEEHAQADVDLAACLATNEQLERGIAGMDASRKLAWCRYRECNTGEPQNCD